MDNSITNGAGPKDRKKSRKTIVDDNVSQSRSIKSTAIKKGPTATLMRLEKIEKYLHERFDWMGLKRQATGRDGTPKNRVSPSKPRSKMLQAQLTWTQHTHEGVKTEGKRESIIKKMKSLGSRDEQQDMG